MIYITQLIFVKEGEERVFLEFEELVIPLMQKHGGELMYRIRPTKDNFVSGLDEKPYEIHFVLFESEQHLQNYMNDDTRLEFMYLKDESVKSIISIKGHKL